MKAYPLGVALVMCLALVHAPPAAARAAIACSAYGEWQLCTRSTSHFHHPSYWTVLMLTARHTGFWVRLRMFVQGHVLCSTYVLSGADSVHVGHWDHLDESPSCDMQARRPHTARFWQDTSHTHA